MRCRLFFVVSCWMACGLAASAADSALSYSSTPEQIGVRIDGQPFAMFNLGTGLAKPYVFPLRAPGGHVVNTVAPFDHKHHKGVWIGVEKVNGVNFWGGKYQQQDAVHAVPASERIESQAAMVNRGDNDSLVVTLVNNWQGGSGKTVLKEETNVTIYPNRLMVYDIALKSVDVPVKFEDTKEGFLAIRVAPTMNGSVGGVIANAAGDVGEENCWGKTSPWVDYSGPVDGKTVGVALFDHPKNLRPSRYHVRGYGLFAISPFGEKVYSKGQSGEIPTSLAPGETFRVKYGLFVHAGDAVAGKVAEAYDQFVAWTK